MVTIGLICMQNKATAKPMVEILKRLTSDLDIEVKIFPQEMILNEPIENWPTGIH